MKRILLVLLVLVSLVPVRAASGPLSPEQKAWLARAERSQKDGWIYLRIGGEPRERGFQHGYLLAKEITESVRVRRELWKHTSGMDWEWLVAKAKAVYTPKVDPENLAEIDGIVEGLSAAGVPSSRDEIAVYNGWFELSAYWWPEEKKKLGLESPDPPKQACSSFIATGSMTAGGGIVLAHNTMFGYAEADANVILDVEPTRGRRILMQAYPGYIHSGTDFFITSAGLVGSETTIGGFNGFDEQGVPEFARFRRATQDASSIDQWVSIMKQGNNGGVANAWLLGDINKNEIARLELGLRYTAFEKKRDGYFIGSNIAEDLKVLRLETDMNSDDIRGNAVARRVRWKSLMQQFSGKIDVELAKRFEADHYDETLQKDNAGSHSLCAHGDLDPQPGWPGGTPFNPGGTFDAKVVDSRMAKQMAFLARWGSACGTAFDAPKFLSAHPQFDWMEGILKSRPAQPWTEFRTGSRK